MSEQVDNWIRSQMRKPIRPPVTVDTSPRPMAATDPDAVADFSPGARTSVPSPHGSGSEAIEQKLRDVIQEKRDRRSFVTPFGSNG